MILFLYFNLFLKTIEKCVWWKTKTGLLRFLQVFVFTNIFFLRPYREQIQELLLRLIADERLEVRTLAAQTLSGLFHCAYLSVDQILLVYILNMQQKKLKIFNYFNLLKF